MYNGLIFLQKAFKDAKMEIIMNSIQKCDTVYLLLKSSDTKSSRVLQSSISRAPQEHHDVPLLSSQQ